MAIEKRKPSSSQIPVDDAQSPIPSKEISAPLPPELDFLASATRRTHLVTILLLILSVITVVLVAFAIPVTILASRNRPSGQTLAQTLSLFVGSDSCPKVKWARSLLQLVFNGFVTVILAGSNDLQQICTSPSHEEFIKDIKQRGERRFGTTSPFALFRSRSKRIFIWFALFITSVPIALFMNQIVGYARTLAIDDVPTIGAYYSTQMLTIPSNSFAEGNEECYRDLQAVFKGQSQKDNAFIQTITVILQSNSNGPVGNSIPITGTNPRWMKGDI